MIMMIKHDMIWYVGSQLLCWQWQYSDENDDDVDDAIDGDDDDDDDIDDDDDDDGAKTRYDICGIPPPVISPQFGWKQPIINCTPHPTLLSPQNTKILIQLPIQIQIQNKD